MHLQEKKRHIFGSFFKHLKQIQVYSIYRCLIYEPSIVLQSHFFLWNTSMCSRSWISTCVFFSSSPPKNDLFSPLDVFTAIFIKKSPSNTHFFFGRIFLGTFSKLHRGESQIPVECVCSMNSPRLVWGNESFHSETWRWSQKKIPFANLRPQWFDGLDFYSVSKKWNEAIPGSPLPPFFIGWIPSHHYLSRGLNGGWLPEGSIGLPWKNWKPLKPAPLPTIMVLSYVFQVCQNWCANHPQQKKGGSQHQPSAVGCFEKCEAAIFGKPTKNHHGINISYEQ